MQPAVWRHIGAIAILAVLVAPAAWAAGPTAEEDTWAELVEGQYPVTVSGDSQWVIYYDRQHRLHRQSIDHPEQDETIPLPYDATDLATSYSGQWVAFSSHYGDCQGLVDFGTPGNHDAPKSRWLKTGHIPCPDFNTPYKGDDDFITSPVTPLTLSPDGKQIALQRAGAINIIDTGTGSVTTSIPISGNVTALQFTDAGHKLFVAMAASNQTYEGLEDAASYTDFAVWNLDTGDLQNFAHLDYPSGLVNTSVFLSDFAEGIGALYSADSSGTVISTNLKQCGPRFIARPYSARDGIAADPQGRWVATLGVSMDETSTHSQVSLYAPASGRLLISWKVDVPLGALTASPDGKVLFATVRGTPPVRYGVVADPARYALPPDSPNGLVRFDVPANLLDAKPATDTSWPNTFCPIENEQPGARNITDTHKKLVAHLSLPLTDLDAKRASLSDANPCKYQDYYTIYTAPSHDGESTWKQPSWGVTPDGSLWLDRFDTLEKIDPASGQVLERLPTPRSPTVCSAVLYEQSAFLTFGGDTLALQPFDKSKPAHVIDTKPDYTLYDLRVRDGQIVSLWQANKDLGKETYDSDVVGERYYIKSGNKHVFSHENFINLFEVDVPASELEDSIFEIPVPQPGAITWETSYLGSVRAVLHGNTDKTILWDGLNFNRPLTLRGQPIESASPSVGVVQTIRDLLFYDAKKHAIIAHSPASKQGEARMVSHDQQVVMQVNDQLEIASLVETAQGNQKEQGGQQAPAPSSSRQ